MTAGCHGDGSLDPLLSLERRSPASERGPLDPSDRPIDRTGVRYREKAAGPLNTKGPSREL